MRRFSGLFLTFLGVDAIVGLGVYLLPGKLAATLGSWSVWVFPLCALLLMPVVLAFAELARRSTRNGGPYAFATMTFGPRWAFHIGWLDWLGTVIGFGLLSALIGRSLGATPALAAYPWAGRVIPAGLILALTAANLGGAKGIGKAVLGLTWLKLAPLVAVAVAGLWSLDFHALAATPLPTGEGRLSSAILMALFICQGFEVAAMISGETRDAARTVPRALMASLWIAVALYTTLQLGIVSGPAVGSERPIGVQAETLFGPAGGHLVELATLVSVLGLLACRALVAPRILLPLCEDGHLPRILARKSRRDTPVVSILVTAVVALIFCYGFDIDAFIEISALGIALQYLITALALARLVWRDDRRTLLLAGAAVAVSLVFLAQVPAKAWWILAAMSATGIALKLGSQPWMLAGTCESDGSWAKSRSR